MLDPPQAWHKRTFGDGIFTGQMPFHLPTTVSKHWRNVSIYWYKNIITCIQLTCRIH